MHCYRAATDVGHYAMAASLNRGQHAWLGRRSSGSAGLSLYAAANYRPAPGNGLVFLPHLHGERTPYLDPTMRGGWLGLVVRAHPDRPAVRGSARRRLRRAPSARRAGGDPTRRRRRGTAARRRRHGVCTLAPVARETPSAGSLPRSSAVGLSSRCRLPRRPGRRFDHRPRPARRSRPSWAPTTTPSPDTALHDRTFAAFRAAALTNAINALVVPRPPGRAESRGSKFEWGPTVGRPHL